MKTRITNLLTATLWLLIVAVWVPTFWVLVQLPGTWDGSDTSGLAYYTETDIRTVYAVVTKDGENCPLRPSKGDYTNLFCERHELSTKTNDRFIPFVVFTLFVLGGQYLLSGKVALSFTKEQDAEEDE